MAEHKHEAKMYGTFNVSDGGQVVISANARKPLEINPGDLFFVMTGRDHPGLIIVKDDTMKELAERIIQGSEAPRPGALEKLITR
jgi:bifunctional DNA-binding transcriptional regulator/antitoxin component of YhaV-PrlF toxin-antitoxin module